MKIYLAGQDVFRRDAFLHFGSLKMLCKDYGYEGLSPLDGDVVADLNSLSIFKANISLINGCDVVIANINCFRGPNVDDGTSFEIGYAYARGVRVYGYRFNKAIDYKTLIELRKGNINLPQSLYPIIEDFGHCCNLMISHAITESGGIIGTNFKECLDHLKDNESIYTENKR